MASSRVPCPQCGAMNFAQDPVVPRVRTAVCAGGRGGSCAGGADACA